MTINDTELCSYQLKIEQEAKRLEMLTRDGRGADLWDALEKIGLAAQLAQYRLMEIK
jgi:hypothetical protein